MASFIKLDPQPGFVRGLAKGIPQGVDNFQQRILPELLKQKKAEIDKEAAQEALDASGFELDELTVDKDGKLKRSFKKPESISDKVIKNPAKSIQRAILGIDDAGGVTDALGLKRTEGPVGPEGTHNPMIEALREKFAGGAADDVIGRDFLGLPAPKAEKKLNFNDAAVEAISGNDFGNLRTLFPTKFDAIQKIEDQNTPVTKDPDFKEGTGGLISRVRSFFSGKQAELTTETKTVIENIKNKADLNEFIEDIEDYKEAGVDTKAILEFFGVKQGK